MDSRLTIRALQREDAPLVQAFVRRLSVESRRRRYFAPINELTPSQLERVTVGAGPDDLNLGAFDAEGRIVGLAQYATEDGDSAEFGVVVDDALQRGGLGTCLVQRLLEAARERGLAALNGLVLYDNWSMLGLAVKLGFELAADRDPALMRVEKILDARRAQWTSMPYAATA